MKYIDGFLLPMPRKMMDPSKKLFDDKRMRYGGFKVLVDVRRSA